MMASVSNSAVGPLQHDPTSTIGIYDREGIDIRFLTDPQVAEEASNRRITPEESQVLGTWGRKRGTGP